MAFIQFNGVTTLYADAEAFVCSDRFAKALSNNGMASIRELDTQDTEVLVQLIEQGSVVPLES